MAQLNLTIIPFDKPEKDAFRKTWLSMVSIWNRDKGLVMLFTIADAELSMLFATHMKHRFNSDTFVGSNASSTNTFGMRWPLTPDLLQDDANPGIVGAELLRILDWRQENEFTTGLWRQGRRNWISSRPANTGSFDDAADTRIRLRDDNDSQKWGFLFLAIQEINPDPIVNGVIRDFGNSERHTVVNIRWHMVSSEFQIHKLDDAMMVDDNDPMRVGLEIVTRNTGAASGGDAVRANFQRRETFVVPIGPLFFNSARGSVDNTTIGFPRPLAI